MGIIIVEGPDGAGKTTLLRKLREQSKNYFWIASSSGRPRTLAELNESLNFLSKCTDANLPVICDRFPLISEAVYGPVLRDVCLLDQMGHRDQEGATQLMKQVDRVIYCRPPVNLIRQNITTSAMPQLLGVLEKLPELVTFYDKLMDVLRDDNVFVYTYDYTSNNLALDDMFFGRL